MDVLDNLTIPLFPLDTVLFPGGVLPLRIFEPRYLDMISDCMKTESGIGVILIEKGHESGAAAKVHEFGTLSFISYWHKRNDGMLGITLKGQQRFRVLSTDVKDNQLTIAEIELLPDFIKTQTAHDSEEHINLLQQIISRLEPPYTTMEKHYDDLDWVSARLIELLPLSLKDKQNMLVISDVNERMEYLQPLLVSMEMI